METYVRLIDLPITVKGMTVTDGEGNYNVYLNNKLSQNTIIKTYIHELKHIENNDFESIENVANIEKRSKNY
ncbi:hypothetical protein REC12_15535 [Desulfosporosinus sp. PR]|uniref:hypothetical protein n=1 Tax=Candidatus Desulfosporosinus nitrosoreducens TaxID=3401928 RepID=UPI0027EF0B04|nr:hypothetical protein [Desulfosporosinus sp. PR]MDQ7095008.1 hypothetical protein [Desulfosporosinus sp. PR]